MIEKGLASELFLLAFLIPDSGYGLAQRLQNTTRTPNTSKIYPVLNKLVKAKYLKKENDYRKGDSPFNNYITLKGKNVKVCSWINDVKRIDPIDSNYIISDDTLTPFHRGMKMDEALLKRRGSKPQLIS